MEEFVLHEEPPIKGWRRLPTGWIHLVFVECMHIWLAVMSWHSFMTTINYSTALLLHDINTGPVMEYYSDLYFKGHAESVTIVFNNGSALVLPDQWITESGVNVPWMIVGWMLPIAAICLALYIVLSFAQTGIWSFEEAAYLNFTWQLPRRKPYTILVACMAVGPIILPILWLVQLFIYVTGKEMMEQLSVFRHCTLSGIFLLISLNLLAFPTVPLHNWSPSAEFSALVFRRSPLSFLLGRNNNFGLKLLDALWTAQHGDKGRLKHYLHDPSQADRVLAICSRAQEAESKARKARVLAESDSTDEGSPLEEHVYGRRA